MRSRLKALAFGSLLATVLCSAASAAHAQEIGVVAAVEPTAEIGRAGSWFPAALGTPIQQGDSLRTGQSGRVRVIFADDSVLSLAAGSELLVDESVYEASGGRVRSVLELLRGKVRSIVNEYVGGSFELSTPTAVAGVRGTDFVVVYDEDTATTDVVGVAGVVGVRSKLGVVAPEVTLHAQYLTRVERGKLPTTPERLDDMLFLQYLDGFDFIGSGHAESLAFGQPLLSGNEVPPDDRLAVPPPPLPGAEPFEQPPPDSPFDVPDVSTLIEQPPASVTGGPGELGVRF